MIHKYKYILMYYSAIYIETIGNLLMLLMLSNLHIFSVFADDVYQIAAKLEG